MISYAERAELPAVQRKLTWAERIPVAYWWPEDLLAIGGRGWTHGGLLYTLGINGRKPEGK